jgi:uncharacterized protein
MSHPQNTFSASACLVSTHPRTWIIVSDKSGDNGQVETIAEALPWPCEKKFLQMKPEYVQGKPRFSASLHHIDLERSDLLEAPWPDLILTVGRRPSMASLWVKRQSGGHSKVVLVGKPTGRMMDFDLIICSAEKHMPPMPNCQAIELPLMRVDEAGVKAEAELWRQRWQDLPRPLIAFLIGGATSPYVMNRKVALELIELANWVVDDLGGTPYFTTSRRTSPVVVDILRESLPGQAVLYEWTAAGGDNPYRALMGLADGFVVSGDSISMMVEVVYLRRPLAIFSLPYSALGRIDQYRRSFARWLFNPRLRNWTDKLRHSLARVIFHLDVFTLLSSTRDFKAFHQLLVDGGLAVWSGQSFAPPAAELPDDVPSAVSRVKALFD